MENVHGILPLFWLPVKTYFKSFLNGFQKVKRIHFPPTPITFLKFIQNLFKNSFKMNPNLIQKWLEHT